MPKYIHFTLAKIKQSGKPIGNDVRIEVRCQDLFLGIDKKVKKGSTTEISKEIGKIYAEGSSFKVPVSIKVIENDIIYNDVGEKDATLEVSLNDNTPQLDTYEIEVKEKRGKSLGSRPSIFAVAIEATVKPVYLYVSPDIEKGWLWVKRQDGKEDISLPAYLKVRHDRTEGKRQYITIEEGLYQGVQASVKLNDWGESYLQTKNLQTGPVNLTYSISKKELRLGREKYSAKDSIFSKWEKGFYDIEIPDFPHEKGRIYREAKHGLSWFRVGHDGARYLHTGRASAGCITLTEQNKWDGLYQILVKARKNDGRSVGAIEVIK